MQQWNKFSYNKYVFAEIYLEVTMKKHYIYERSKQLLIVKAKPKIIKN